MEERGGRGTPPPPPLYQVFILIAGPPLSCKTNGSPPRPTLNLLPPPMDLLVQDWRDTGQWGRKMFFIGGGGGLQEVYTKE